MSIDTAGLLIAAALKGYGESSDRSMQSAAGIMGPSDLGFCRNKAALMTRGVEQSDSVSIAAAQVGTAVHTYAGEALKAYFPGWIIDERRVTATFPSGAEVSGTPDIIAPDLNALIDIKTVDGFEWVKREGTSQNHRYQRHTYALGAIQEGLLDPHKPVYVGNLYIDRSGKQPEPYFVWEEFDHTLTDEIDSWIADVQYAVMNREDASRDIPAPICQRICSYYTACRGGLPMEEGGEAIIDATRVSAIRLYIEGRDMEKVGGKMKREAQAALLGTNGTANIDGTTMQVRWTHIGETDIAATRRAAYDRLDIRTLAGGS